MIRLTYLPHLEAYAVRVDGKGLIGFVRFNFGWSPFRDQPHFY